MLYITGTPILLGPETDVYVRCNVCFFNFAYVNGDEDTDIEALPTSVNFRCLSFSCLITETLN